MSDDDEVQDEQIEIALDMSQMAGVWANFARVSHSQHEFTLDFVRLDYATNQPRQGVVVARVSVSPLFITQLRAALDENWEQYARKALPKEVYENDDHDQED
jgi:hypothetical protein